MMKTDLETIAARLCAAFDIHVDAELLELLYGEPMRIALMNPPASLELRRRAIIRHIAQYAFRLAVCLHLNWVHSVDDGTVT